MRSPFHSLAFRYRFWFPLLAHVPSRCHAYALAGCFHDRVEEARRRDLENIQAQMARAFPHLSAVALAREAEAFFRLNDRDVLDTWMLSRYRRRSLRGFIELEGFDALLEARAGGRAVMISSGHFGRFWMTGLAMRRRGVTVGTITRDGIPENNPELPPEEFHYRLEKLGRLRQALGGPFLVLGDPLRRLLRAVDEHVMAVFFDVPYEGAVRPGTLEIPFFGRPARFPAGIARIARHRDALIFPFFMHERAPHRLCAEFLSSLDPRMLSDTDILAALVAALEMRIRQTPHAWWLWPALPAFWQERP